MIDRLHRSECITAAAAAVLLQAALCGVLSTQHSFLPGGTGAPPLTAEMSHAGERPKATFGFPQAPAKHDPLPAFGWDEAHIDRVQRIGHGIIDVGPCTITLAFPIPICHFGKGSANGDLFEHMHDRPTGEPR